MPIYEHVAGAVRRNKKGPIMYDLIFAAAILSASAVTLRAAWRGEFVHFMVAWHLAAALMVAW